jgi:hypothetical protein
LKGFDGVLGGIGPSTTMGEGNRRINQRGEALLHVMMMSRSGNSSKYSAVGLHIEIHGN